MTLPNVTASLLDDLRNATEYFKAAQEAGQKGGRCCDIENLADACEWLRTAALNLGEALIAGHGDSEVPHA